MKKLYPKAVWRKMHCDSVLAKCGQAEQLLAQCRELDPRRRNLWDAVQGRLEKVMARALKRKWSWNWEWTLVHDIVDRLKDEVKCLIS